MRIQKEGQVFSSDFLIGLIVLLFILTALQVYHSNMMQQIEHQQKLLYRESLLSKTDTLILSEGVPKNWNTSNVEVLGFSTGEPNHLNETKIRRFADKENVSRLLGLRGKDFYFAIENTTEQVISGAGKNYRKGTKNWGAAEDVYTAKRKVFLEESDQKAILRLVVW